MERKGILRMIDANYNRCCEGLRVVEDIFRFIDEDDALRKQIRTLRHSITRLLCDSKLRTKAVYFRNSVQDCGRKIDTAEMKRRCTSDTLYANVQRAKESMRVIEESLKLIYPADVHHIKRLRYRLYEIERKII